MNYFNMFAVDLLLTINKNPNHKFYENVCLVVESLIMHIMFLTQIQELHFKLDFS